MSGTRGFTQCGVCDTQWEFSDLAGLVEALHKAQYDPVAHTPDCEYIAHPTTCYSPEGRYPRLEIAGETLVVIEGQRPFFVRYREPEDDEL